MREAARIAAWVVYLGFCASYPALAQERKEELYLPFPEQSLANYKAIADLDPKAWLISQPTEAGLLTAAAVKMPKRIEASMRVENTNTPGNNVRNTRSESVLTNLGDGYFATVGKGDSETGGGDTRSLVWAGYITLHGHAHVSTTAPGGVSVEGTVVRKLSEVKAMTLRLSDIKPGYKWNYDLVYTIENLLRTKTALFTRGPNATKRTNTQKSECVAESVVPAGTVVEGATGNAVIAKCDSEFDRRLLKTTLAYLEDYAWFVGIRTENEASGIVVDVKVSFPAGN